MLPSGFRREENGMPFLEFAEEGVLLRTAVQEYRGKTIDYICSCDEAGASRLVVKVEGEESPLGKETETLAEALALAEGVASDVAFGELDDLLGEGLEPFPTDDEELEDVAGDD